MNIKENFKQILFSHKYYVVLYLVGLYFLHLRDYHINGKFSGLADFFLILPRSFVDFFAIFVTYWLWFLLLGLIAIILLYVGCFYVIQSLTQSEPLALWLSSVVIVGIAILYAVFANANLLYFGAIAMISEFFKYKSLHRVLSHK